MNTQQNGSNEEARQDDLDPRASHSAEAQSFHADSADTIDESPLAQPPSATIDDALPAMVDAADMHESLGQRLRAAREARGLSREEAATGTKMRAAIIVALESDQFDRIGHGVYLRGYLTKYLAFLGLPVVLADRVLQQHAELPPLMTSGTISRPRYLFQRYSGSALYLVLTGVIIVPAVLLAMRAGFDSNLVRIAPLDTSESAQTTAHTDVAMSNSPTVASTDASVGAQSAKPSADDKPLAASMAPFPPTVEMPKPIEDAATPIGQHTLKITFTEASWVDVATSDGHKLEQGIVAAGTTRVYHSEQSLDVHLGNVNGASVEVDGKAQDLTAYRHSNVAHFKLAAGENTLSHSGG